MPPKTYKRYLEQDVREHGRPGDLWGKGSFPLNLAAPAQPIP